jgi:hypothetical protein
VQARDDERATGRKLPTLNRGADDDDRLRRSPMSPAQRDDSDRPRARPRNGDTDQLLLPRRREKHEGGGAD